MSVIVPVSNQYAHPPLDLLTAKHHVADVSGQGVIPQADLLPGFGIQWGVLLIGVQWGYTLGYVNTYESRIAQLVVEWDIGASGAKQLQIEDLYHDRGFFWYAEQLPARLNYYCGPGVTIELNRVAFI